MPHDITRVLIFERLEYLVEDKKHAASAQELYEQQLELIQQVKQFYFGKLDCVAKKLDTSMGKCSSQEKSFADSNTSHNDNTHDMQGNIEDTYWCITKLIYGKDGFIAFLNKLFLGTDHTDRFQFNYYFALKSQL